MPPTKMDPERYAEFKASGRLPSPKGIALSVIRLLRRDDYQLADLVQLLQSDPAMAGRLLKYANAAAYGNTRPIIAIAKAVLVLGAHRIRDLVLGFSILHEYRSGLCQAFSYETFWSRSLATAIASEVLARHAQIASEESFTLGLLCDIGFLALASYDCGLYGQAMQAADGNAELLIEAERSTFGTDHRELGAAQMSEWGIPESLVCAAYYCETPDTAGLVDGSRQHILTLSLYIARTIAEICVADAPERWKLLPTVFAKAARLGITPDQFTLLTDDIVCRWHDWGATLRLRTHELPPFAELLSAMPPGELAAAALTPQRSAIIVGASEPASGKLAAALATLGYTTQQIANGSEGLIAVLEARPQLVIIAIDSPEMDGATFCRAFRTYPLSHETHLLLLGSREQEERIGQAMEAGADDYLPWPVSNAALRARLHAAEKITHLREEIRRERRGMIRSAGEWAGCHRRMMEMALSDPLTRLPNRRYGLDFIAAEWDFALAKGRSLACLMVDIDHFKAINDTHGHVAGDAVLTCVAKILGEHCRSEDMAFRYGGEEFCVVCTDTDLDVARIVAERIRSGIERESRTCGEMNIPVTVSVGIATIAPAQASAEALVKEADSALYRAKQNGRNRVEA